MTIGKVEADIIDRAMAMNLLKGANRAESWAIGGTGVPGGHAPGPKLRFSGRRSPETDRRSLPIGGNAEFTMMARDSAAFRNSLNAHRPTQYCRALPVGTGRPDDRWRRQSFRIGSRHRGPSFAGELTYLLTGRAIMPSGGYVSSVTSSPASQGPNSSRSRMTGIRW